MPKATEMQIVELLYGSTPAFDFTAILRRAREVVPNVGMSDPADQTGQVTYMHPMYVAHLADGQMHPATVLVPRYKEFNRDDYIEELQQSWSCPNADELLGGIKAVGMLTEMFARQQAPMDRAMLFHGVLQAVVEITNPVALVFLHSQQVVAADQYLADCRHEPVYRSGSLNVRFVTISDSDGDMLMDTRGLYELGLHDLQCHFRKLDPNDVARKLRDVAVYIVENGAIIESGQTVPGISERDKWVCQFENAILPPNRTLLDLNPGKKYAAGRP